MSGVSEPKPRQASSIQVRQKTLMKMTPPLPPPRYIAYSFSLPPLSLFHSLSSPVPSIFLPLKHIHTARLLHIFSSWILQYKYITGLLSREHDGEFFKHEGRLRRSFFPPNECCNTGKENGTWGFYKPAVKKLMVSRDKSDQDRPGYYSPLLASAAAIHHSPARTPMP